MSNIYHSITEYLKAKQRWEQVPATIVNGQGFVFVKGNWISFEEYNLHNSKPVYEKPPVENPDKKNVTSSIIPLHKRK